MTGGALEGTLGERALLAMATMTAAAAATTSSTTTIQLRLIKLFLLEKECCDAFIGAQLALVVVVVVVAICLTNVLSDNSRRRCRRSCCRCSLAVRPTAPA